MDEMSIAQSPRFGVEDMTNLHFPSLPVLVFLLPLVVYLQGCRDANSLDVVSASLKNTETYQYPTVGGEEEGALVSKQANHYSISEIRRNAETNWVAVYVYQPAAGFVGSDQAEIKIVTGSDGASPPTHTKTVVFRFDIHN
jgi:hypothetical protein